MTRKPKPAVAWGYFYTDDNGIRRCITANTHGLAKWMHRDDDNIVLNPGPIFKITEPTTKTKAQP